MPNRTTPLTTPVLGRGQGARTAAAAVSREGERALASALTIPIEQIAPDPAQPRRTMDAEGLRDLAASLVEYGVLQPLLVREEGRLDDGRTRYMIVAGGRRYAAALLAGLTRLPVVVRDTEGAALRVTQLIENVQRQDLAPLEEARAFKELMDAEKLSPSTLAARLHVSVQKISDRLLVLSDPVIADAVTRGQITPTTARDTLRLADEAQAPLRARIAEGTPIDATDIRRARADAEAAGVVNKRAKGGGRRAEKQPTDTSTTAPARPQDHTAYDPASLDTLPPAPVDGVRAALGPLQVSDVTILLQYGAARQWTCLQLLDALNEQERDAAP